MPPLPASGSKRGGDDGSKRSKGDAKDLRASRKENKNPHSKANSPKRKDEGDDPRRKPFEPRRDPPPLPLLRTDPLPYDPKGGPLLIIVSKDKVSGFARAQFEEAGPEDALQSTAAKSRPAYPHNTPASPDEHIAPVRGNEISKLPMLTKPRFPAAEPEPRRSISVRSDWSFVAGGDEDITGTGPSRATTTFPSAAAQTALERRKAEYAGLASFTESTKSRHRPRRMSSSSGMSSKSEPRIPAGHDRSEKRLVVSPSASKNEVKRDSPLTNFLIGKPSVKWRTLILYTNQGGTFGFGQRFLAEDRSTVVTVNERRDARHPDNTKWRTKHHLYYGDGVEVIGTKECVTCVGVYFEIKDSRVFCAHINAFPNADREDPTEIVVGSTKYHDIRANVAQRLYDHSKLYGWEPSEVNKLSLRMVCPYPARGGIAVIHAVRRGFLGFKKGAWYPAVEAAHGFAFAPASTRPEMGRLFIYRDQVRHRDGRVEQIWDDLPEDVLVEALFQPSTGSDKDGPWNDNDEVGTWGYTAGDEGV